MSRWMMPLRWANASASVTPLMMPSASSSGELDFAKESILPEVFGKVGVEDLDRDLTMMLRVVGQIDGSHTAAADLAHDAITAGQRRR